MRHQEARNTSIAFDMPYAEYAALPGLRASAVTRGRTSMLHMHHEITRERTSASNAMRWGTLMHWAILEYPVFLDGARVYNEGSKKTKGWRAHVEEHGAEITMTGEEYDKLIRLHDRAWADEAARPFLEFTHREIVVQWEDELGAGPCKARLDGLHDHLGITELKSAGQIESRRFFNTGFDLGYHLKFGWYWEGLRLAQPDFGDIQVNVICIEQTEPHAIVVYRVPHTIIEAGRDEAMKIARRYRTCEQRGTFPGPASGVQEYALPTWATGAEPVALQIDGEDVEV